jgi:ABC-type antimicrobial peptide transport system permease subunit
VAFAVAGGALGVMVAFIGGRWIEPLLFRQSATSPAIYAGVSATMCAVALAASVVPAWRAARADPIVALRAE